MHRNNVQCGMPEARDSSHSGSSAALDPGPLFCPGDPLLPDRYPNDLRCGFAAPAESQTSRSSDIDHPLRVETGKACPAGAARAGVYDAWGAALQQLFSQCLRCHVAGPVEASRKALRSAQIGVLTVEVRKVVIELDFILVPSDFREVDGFVKPSRLVLWAISSVTLLSAASSSISVTPVAAPPPSSASQASQPRIEKPLM